MIRYALCCENDHRFESWFRNADAFETLVKDGQVACPECNSTNISKSLMAPRIGGRTKNNRTASPAAAPEHARAVVPQAEKLRSMLRTLRRKVEETCDDVGADFAEEARRIHYGEVEPRGIYGETSPEDA